ncbi:ATP-dependent protease LonB [Clostridium sp. 19966]|uniref:ATP-dependent protease LonB n=1 Tax=Clostridium sp. 19966 TaxID=2768166 RepID=UPI0028DE37DA|nr:ATP-dependent protease LonB [Clostridium sp. 19966]MDT8719372.1 ATP-dependent protease LonB [Clostridium sp. 19966]
MTQILMVIQFFFTLVMGLYFYNALKTQQNSKVTMNLENKKELDKLKKMRQIKLSEPLTEKGRPKAFEEIIGQQEGIKALKAALCGPNPQHIIIYGPPGVGKTAAARLVLEAAKKNINSPFQSDARFVEIDATTIRFDDRGIADPLIGSVHDPIYQGAGALGIAGIPQPKPGAVTKAHGGILFIDEIGELHPIELNKLLKVLEDRRVYLDSAYYNSSDSNVPQYVRDIFENGLPADFRLIGATTRSPEEINPAIRSRCIEIFFRELLPEEIEIIAKNSAEKLEFKITDGACQIIAKYCSNGRESLNLVQMAYGAAVNENKNVIDEKEVLWVIDNGDYHPRIEKLISDKAKIGCVNGLGVYGANIGILMEIEATVKRVKLRKGKIKISGIIEEEQITSGNKKVIRKSNALCSVDNVITVLSNDFNINCDDYNININFPGGAPIDGTSAGISIFCAIYSCINNIAINSRVAMTGEISLHGDVNPVGGVSAKINAAKRAGATKVIIPRGNYDESIKEIQGIDIILVSSIYDVINEAFFDSIDSGRLVLEKENNKATVSAKGI